MVAPTLLDPGGDATGDGAHFWTSKGLGTSSTVTYDTGFAHSGTGSWKLTTGGANQRASLFQGGGAFGATTRISFWAYPTAPASAAGVLNMLIPYSTSEGFVSSFVIAMDDAYHLRVHGSTFTSEALTPSAWSRIALCFTITSASVNEAVLFVNGAEWLRLTNINLTGAALLPNAPELGICDGSSVAGAVDWWIDDIYIDQANSLADPGNIYVVAKRPAGTGTNEFDTAIGSGATRWSHVNEVPISTTNGWRDATPTAGDLYGSTTLTTTRAISAGNKRATQFTTGATGGTVESIAVHADRSQSGGNTANEFWVAIYTDSSGNPNALVANSAFRFTAGIARNAPAWYTATYVTPPTLSAGTTYWVCAGPWEANAILYESSDAAYDLKSVADAFADGPADPFGSPATVADTRMAITVQMAAGAAALETYTVETQSGGDVDLTGATLVARLAWVYAAGSGAGTAKLIDSGTETDISLTTTPTVFTRLTDTATYPTGTDQIGLRAIPGATDTDLYDCGVVIAAAIPVATGATAALATATVTGAAPAITAIAALAATASLATATTTGSVDALTVTGGGLAALLTAAATGTVDAATVTGGGLAPLAEAQATAAAPSLTAFESLIVALATATATATSDAATATGGGLAALAQAPSSAQADALTATGGALALLAAAAATGDAAAISAFESTVATLATAASAAAADALTVTGGGLALLDDATVTGAVDAISAIGSETALLAEGTATAAAPSLTVIATSDATALLAEAVATATAPSLTAAGGALALLATAAASGDAQAISAFESTVAALATAAATGSVEALTALGGGLALLSSAAITADAPSVTATGGGLALLATALAAAAADGITTSESAVVVLAAAASAATVDAISVTGGGLAVLDEAEAVAAADAILAGEAATTATLSVASAVAQAWALVVEQFQGRGGTETLVRGGTGTLARGGAATLARGGDGALARGGTETLARGGDQP